MSRGVSAEWVERYLRLLGVPREPPSLAALGRLTRAHILTVPFENVTSILRRRDHPGDGDVSALDPDAMLCTWERRAGGGVCFEITEMVPRLLNALGYDARASIGQLGEAGRITWLGAHLGVVVTVDGDRYLVDAGNGAPFFEPIPLDAVTEVHRAGLSWRFRQGSTSDAWVQERLMDGRWVEFCAYDLRLPDRRVLGEAYQRHHQLDQSWVASDFFMVCCTDDAISVVRDGALTRYSAEGKEVSPLSTDRDYERLAADVFGLPAMPILEARRVLAAQTPA